MVVPNVDINYWAVLVSAVVSMIIGGLWYSPVLFGNLWMKLSGITEKSMNEMKKKGGSAGKSYFWSFIMTLISMYVLAHFVKYVSAVNFMDGIQLGAWAWLGFMVPLALNEVLWGGKSMKLFLLNAAHHLIAVCVGAGILAVWQ